MPNHQSFLWQVSHSGQTSPSYLFGTMHVQDLRAFSNLKLLQEKIDACEAFAAEFHLGEKPVSMSSHALLPSGVRLQTLTSEKRFHKLRRIILKSTGLDLEHYQQFSPFLLIGLISSQLLGKEMPHGLDEYLWNYAKSKEKKLLGIETLAEQMAVLENIPLDEQMKMLLQIGKNINAFRRHAIHCADLYEKGELQRLSKTVIKQAGKLRKRLIYHRNEIMAQRIGEWSRQMSLFATVGAGHLGGGKGVIRLLKQQGFKLSPVR